jgi:hypothetical protein
MNVLRNWFRSLSSARRTPRPKRTTRPLLLECLEERTLLSAHLTLAGAQTLVANTNVNVAASSNTVGTVESEMVVDVNPTNPLNVVGFTHNVNNFNQIQVFYSIDGGNAWTRRLISNVASSTSDTDGFGQVALRFDPAIKFDANGNLFVAYGVIDINRISTSLVVGRSTNGGASFSQFRAVDFNFGTPDGSTTGGLDKWQLATGRSGPGSQTQAVYVAYTQNISGGGQRIAVAGSNNGGASFTSPVIVNNTASNGNLFADPAVGPNGELYVAWHSHSTGQILFNRDLTGLWAPGNHFGTDIVVRNLTFSLFAYPVPAQPNRGVETGPVLDVDRSGGAFNGRLYISFADRFGGAGSVDTDIFLTNSTNQGTNWSALGTTGNVEGAPSTDFEPWVAVDQGTGSVNVAYYTTDGAPDNTQVNLRLASSRDGGNTFSKTNVSSQRSRAASQTYGGDFLEYIGLAVRDGTAQAFWADNRGATQGTFVSDLHSYSASVSTHNASNNLLVTIDNPMSIDVIDIRRSAANANFVEVVQNGQLQFAGLWASLGSITIDGRGGAAFLTIESSFPNVPTTVLGAIIVTVGNAGGLGDILSPVTINFAGVLTVDDANRGFIDFVSHTYTVTATTVQAPSSGLITYGALGALFLNTGVSVFGIPIQTDVTGTRAGTDTTVTTNAGVNFVSVGNGTLDGIQGPLTVGGPAIVLTVNDANRGFVDFVSHTYTVTATTVQAPSAGLITYGGGVATLSLNTGVSVFGIPIQTDVTGTRAGTDSSVNTNTGVNLVSVGNANRLDDFRGPLTVNGQGGTTILNVNDQGTSSAKVYEIYANAVKRDLNPDLPTYDAVINYANIGSLNVSGGSGGNIFQVVGTAAGTNTSLNGGSGGDEFVADASSFGPDSLLGPLTIHARLGTNSYLVYYDFLATTVQNYILTTNTVSRSGASVTFDNLNQVILYAANVGGNTINVTSLAADVFDNLGAADGDIVTLGSNQTLASVQGPVAIGVGNNASATVVIDDSGNAVPGSITFSNNVNYGCIISGLVPAGIFLAVGQNTTLNTSLRTGAGNHTFNLQTAPQGVALSLDAGTGTNTLDYTGYAGNVLVNLNPSIHSATGFDGGISGIKNVTGASGGAPGSYNVLIGNGHNVLTGGNDRRNLLVAGASASTLIGGNGDDILIGGTTNWDTDPQWQAAYTAIMNEWTQATPYATRWDHLVNGGGLNDPFLLDPTPDTGTVHSNGGGNTLTGHGGGASELNLYFGSEADRAASDWDATEQFFIIV